jgi:hypothetical protein
MFARPPKLLKKLRGPPYTTKNSLFNYGQLATVIWTVGEEFQLPRLNRG